MAQSELLKIQDTLSQVSAVFSTEAGQSLIVSMMQGPVEVFFNPENIKDKQAMQDNIENQLVELTEQYGPYGAK